jgi:hypothetical protein
MDKKLAEIRKRLDLAEEARLEREDRELLARLAGLEHDSALQDLGARVAALEAQIGARAEA